MRAFPLYYPIDIPISITLSLLFRIKLTYRLGLFTLRLLFFRNQPAPSLDDKCVL
jgi:hypothetical protein